MYIFKFMMFHQEASVEIIKLIKVFKSSALSCALEEQESVGEYLRSCSYIDVRF